MLYGVTTGRAKPNNRTGTVRVVTSQWRDLLARTLTDRNLSHRWLEDQIGAPNGSIQQLLRRNSTSRIVDDICRVLSISPPIDAPADVMEIIDIYMSKDEKGKEKLRRILRALDDD